MKVISLFSFELPGVYDNKTTCVVVSLLQLFLLSALVWERRLKAPEPSALCT